MVNMGSQRKTSNSRRKVLGKKIKSKKSPQKSKEMRKELRIHFPPPISKKKILIGGCTAF